MPAKFFQLGFPATKQQMYMHFGTVATLLVASQFMILIPEAVSDETKDMPAANSMLNAWIGSNVQEHQQKMSEIMEGHQSPVDPKLAAAEAEVKVIKVRKDGTGHFKTIADALNSIPEGNNKRTVIWISGGDYWEKITIHKSKPFITLYGSASDMPSIVYNGTNHDATVVIESEYFVAINVAFMNAGPLGGAGTGKGGAAAAAMRVSGDKAAFYNCIFIGYQDTVCDDEGRHLFKDCQIQGTVDFVFGDGKSLYLNTMIQSVAQGVGVISTEARGKVGDDSGFAFVHCNISANGHTYLSPAWRNSPRLVFAYSYIGTLIDGEGASDKVVYYAEYMCRGPGASPSGRPKFAKLLKDEEAKPFLSTTYIDGHKWLTSPPNFA